MKYLYFALLLLLCKCSFAQIITTVAGNGSEGYSGNGGQATSAQLGWHARVATDNSGNIYISDLENNVIRKIDALGVITVYAGTGILGYSGDGGPAKNANVYHPSYLTLDKSNNLYFSDQNGDVIRKIDANGIISTITGHLPTGYSGDGGPLLAAQFAGIAGITFDNNGNMFIADGGNDVIRKVNVQGIISTVAGNGTAGFSGDGGPATSAQLYSPYAVVFDKAGNMYIPDNVNNRIRKVSTDGTITTFAGTGAKGYTGDGGPAALAAFFYPWTIDIDDANNIYVGDIGNNVVRKIAADGTITTYAGTGMEGNTGDGGRQRQLNLEKLFRFLWTSQTTCLSQSALIITSSEK
jgi:hypothetical protein